MKIVAIGNKAFCVGFKLAGLEDVYVIESSKDMEKIIENLNKDEVGIVILQDVYASNMNYKIQKYIEDTALPVFIKINIKGKEVVGESLQSLIKKALGVELKMG